MKSLLLALLFLVCVLATTAQQTNTYYLTADRIFDGEVMHSGWAVIVENDKIIAIGPKESLKQPSGSTAINKPNSTILPGLIEGHSHMFLYPYDIADWDTQVLKESDSYRTARATVHAKKTLLAGFTTARDLGTEGAGFSDVALKRAIDEGLIPGPRLLVAGRAIVATGAYGPKGYDSDMSIMTGAEQADGPNLIRVVRDQIGKGADLIKVYADYKWGSTDKDQPTFSQEELKQIVETAKSSATPTVAHATTYEGMRRAILAGVETIEHGDQMNIGVGKLMREHNVFYIPTIAAVESMAKYKGWQKGKMPDPERVMNKKKSFKEALQSGVVIGMGGDVGVFAHGENVLEMELMVEYGMNTLDVLKAATSVNARAFHLDAMVGSIKPGLKADLIIVNGNPEANISDLRKVSFVMKDGTVYKNER